MVGLVTVYTIYLDHGEAYGNLGDEAMLLNAARRIRQRLGQVRFIIPTRQGAPTPELDGAIEIPSPTIAVQKTFGKVRHLMRLCGRFDLLGWRALVEILTDTFSRWGGGENWRQLRDELSRCDAIYCVGAANLNDFARYNCLLPKYMLFKVAKKERLPIIVSSQTVGPLELRWTKRMVRRMVKEANLFSVRDWGVSRDVLSDADVDVERIPFVGDEAFTLPTAPKAKATQWMERNGVDPGTNFGVLHFRATDYTKQTTSHYPMLAEVLDRIDTDCQILFLPMSYWPESRRDRQCGETIRRMMEKTGKMNVLKSVPSASIAKRIVGMARWSICLSYHVQVFSLAEETPMTILSSGDYYSVKARGMQRLLGNSVPFVDLDTASVSECCEAIEGMKKEHGRIADALKMAKTNVMRNNEKPVEALVQSL